MKKTVLNKGEVKISSLPPGSWEDFKSLRLRSLKELGLVKTRIDKGRYPARNLVAITPKGKGVAMKLREILQLLGK